MTGGWHDVSVALDAELPTWPGSPGVATVFRSAMSRGEPANVTQLSIDVHSGTHVDAPLHFVADGASVEDLGLEPFIGPAVVVDTGSNKNLGSESLEAAGIPGGTERLLLRTENSSRAGIYREPFDEDFAGLTLDGAEWLAALGPRLVGIDYLSIQRFEEPLEVHRVLLSAGIAILEGLNLAGVAPGPYELVCLPMRLVNVEGAPARAILLPRKAESQ